MGNCSGAVRLSQSLNMPAVIKSGHKILALALLLQNAQLSDQTDFYQLSAADISGKQVDFARYEGAAVLVVNLASECGYTDSHYRGLKRLHDILGYNNKLAILCQNTNHITIIFTSFCDRFSLQSIWRPGAGGGGPNSRCCL